MYVVGSLIMSVIVIGVVGGNSGLKIYFNVVLNVNNGILVLGLIVVVDNNDGIDIGGFFVVIGNIILNFGIIGSFFGYVNVLGIVYGICIRNFKNFNIFYNIIISLNGGVILGVFRGIFV